MTRRVDGCVAALCVGILLSFGVPAEGAVLISYRMGGTTLRKCGTTAKSNHADPVNVAFVGTHASWQNSQRAVGRDYQGPDTPGLKWRTTRAVAGGHQSISNSGACTRDNGQSSRGSGANVFDTDLSGTKRHTRFFEQTIPLSFNSDQSARYLLTVQDAHRDVKSRRCRGPGSINTPIGSLNDRVPVKINGYRDGGYNDAQRLFYKAYPPGGGPFRGKAYRTPNRERFVQCAKEDRPRRYSVGWNGILQFFLLNVNIECQSGWPRFKGDCPLGGRTGSVK